MTERTARSTRVRSPQGGGWALLEVIAVVAVLAATMALTGGIFRTLVRDVPRAGRAVEAHWLIGNLLLRMQQDMDEASGVPVRFTGLLAEQAALAMMFKPEGTVAYEVRGERVVRLLLAGDGPGKETASWQLPDTSIRFKLWEQEGNGRGIEVRTAVLVEAGGQKHERLVNTRLFFPGATTRPAQAREGGRP